MKRIAVYVFLFAVVCGLAGAVETPLQFAKAPATPPVGTERGGIATIGVFLLGAHMGELDTDIYNFGVTPVFSIWNNRFGLTGDVPTGYLMSRSDYYDSFSGFNTSQNLNGGLKVWEWENASNLILFTGANSTLTFLNYELQDSSADMLLALGGFQFGIKSTVHVNDKLTILPFYLYSIKGASFSGTVETSGISVDVDSSISLGEITYSTLGFDIELYGYSLAAMFAIEDAETWNFSLAMTILSTPINQAKER
jgi:hypothetical protein